MAATHDEEEGQAADLLHHAVHRQEEVRAVLHKLLQAPAALAIRRRVFGVHAVDFAQRRDAVHVPQQLDRDARHVIVRRAYRVCTFMTN